MKHERKNSRKGSPLHLLTAAVLAAATFGATGAAKKPAFRPVPPTAVARDSLIRPGETRFAHLWQLTFGGQNAEAYWSADGTKLTFQAMVGDARCDQHLCTTSPAER